METLLRAKPRRLAFSSPAPSEPAQGGPVGAPALNYPRDETERPAVAPLETGGEKLPLGERIRIMRNAVGLTRAALAHRAGLSEAAIWHWECKGRNPQSDSLAKVAEALGVTTSNLREGALAAVPSSLGVPVRHPSAPVTLAAILNETRAKVAEAAGLPVESIRITLDLRSG